MSSKFFYLGKFPHCHIMCHAQLSIFEYSADFFISDNCFGVLRIMILNSAGHLTKNFL